ncbi:MAG: ABC transporter permease subunit [Acidimicrobiales bacterium]
MLLTDVTAKTVRDRTPLAVYVGLGIAAAAFCMVMLAEQLGNDMAAMIADLPEALTGIMGGIGSNYVVTELFGLIGPITVLTIAIGGGVNVLAGEERRHTAELLLTQPVSRRSVVRSKFAVLVGDTAIACLFLFLGSSVGASLFTVTGFGPADALAATIHVYFLAVAFGAFALAVANATGSTAAGTGAATGLAVFSNLVAGMLPLVEGAEGWARVSPWYYFNGSEPLSNGLDVTHLGVLATMAAVCFGVAYWVADHRDIGSGGSGLTLRLPALGRITRPRLGRIAAKTLSERVTFLAILSGSMAAMSVLVAFMYGGIKDSLLALNDAFPKSMLELFGATDLSTPTGFLQVEMLSLMTPLALIAVGVIMGLDAVAGEASRRTLGLLVAVPQTRARILLEKAGAMMLAVAVTAIGLWLGLVLAVVLAGLDVSFAKLAAALTHQMLLGLFFGALALALGSFAERSTALRWTMAIVVVTYFGDWFLRQRPSLADAAVISPWFYATETEPMFNGVNPAHLVVLALASAILVGAALWGFERRDLDG